MEETIEKTKNAHQSSIEAQFAIAKSMREVHHKILVMSGKGGVGKSTVAVNLAFGLASLGKSVGILDIDIHGPSVGKMAGIEGAKLFSNEKGLIEPVEVAGVKVITMASLIEADSAVVWRGPMKMKAIDQFLGEVDWGELDYLVIDSPPGTGDEPLSVIQRLPDLDGAVIVTTPQAVAVLDARRTVAFAKQLGVVVLGIIENMSGFICPHCGENTEIFKSGGGAEAAKELEIMFLGKIPIDGAVMSACDEGRAFVLSPEKSSSREAMLEIVEKILRLIEARQE